MIADELCKILGISRKKLFNLKKLEGAPKSFDDVVGWKTWVEVTTTDIRANNKLPSATEANLIFVNARASKTKSQAEILEIELSATRRQIIPQAEVKSLFAKISVVVRGRLLKVRNDLTNALLGQDAVTMDKIIEEKFEDALAPFNIPEEFFEPKSIV